MPARLESPVASVHIYSNFHEENPCLNEINPNNGKFLVFNKKTQCDVQDNNKT